MHLLPHDAPAAPREGIDGKGASSLRMQPKKLLLIKTSSLGDVIHALPAISDVHKCIAGSVVDWVIEESLTAIARLHPGVSDVIPVAMRRWRRAWWRRSIRDEVSAYRRRLRAHTYDAIIDAQGLIKSALITRAARGVRHGLDFYSSREPLAWFYHHTYRISWDVHAVERNRQLFARALGYAVPPVCEYGIRSAPHHFAWLTHDAYAMLLHATSGNYKLWDERNWIELGSALNAAGIACVLPWGNAEERERSMRIAQALPNAVVPPAQDFTDVAKVLAGARVAVGVDTGLTHLAAALGVPTAGIYVATDPAATGIYGCARAVNLGGIGHVPTVQETIATVRELLV
jgi:heptosyltransferase-1